MAMLLDVSYITYATHPKEKTGNRATFTQFEEGSLLSETHNDTKSGNKYDENSTLAPLFSEEERDAMSSGNESDAKHMSTDMLEDIQDGIEAR